jgi:hypothetical protein
MGAVSTLHVVRSSSGAIYGAVTPTGTVVDTSLTPVPQVALCGSEVWSDGLELIGTIQGLAPPLFTLIDSSTTSEKERNAEAGSSEATAGERGSDTVDRSSRVFTVAWSDLRVTGRDGKCVGRWCTKRGCVVDESGAEVTSLVIKTVAEGVPDRLPQAVDNSGNFLGYVLPSKAVVNSSGHQVQHHRLCRREHRTTDSTIPDLRVDNCLVLC